MPLLEKTWSLEASIYPSPDSEFSVAMTRCGMTTWSHSLTNATAKGSRPASGSQRALASERTPYSSARMS